ncbi:MAG: 50S ribosomal protein L25 [Chloroflexota bacterium]
MSEIVLKAQHRSVVGKQVKALRREGALPAVLYGTSVEPTPIQLNLHDTMLLMRGVSGSALITIDLEGKPYKALVREKQYNYIRRELIHLDFQAVSMTEKLRVNVPVETVGTSGAVENFNGILVVNLNELDIECLPGDLPSAIEVDISPLASIGDAITVGQIELSDKLTVYNSPEDVVVVVTGQQQEEEAEGETSEDEPEVVQKNRKEEDF